MRNIGRVLELQRASNFMPIYHARCSADIQGPQFWRKYRGRWLINLHTKPCLHFPSTKVVFFTYIPSNLFIVFLPHITDDKDNMRRAQGYVYDHGAQQQQQVALCARALSSLYFGELISSEPVICHPITPHRSSLPLLFLLLLCVFIDCPLWV